MKMDNSIHALAGTMIMISLSLARWVDHRWLWLAAFVGVNLVQSTFTGFCPAEKVLSALGIAKRKDKSCP